MRFGPVPLEIFEMAKGEAIWLAELSMDRYPWELEGYRLRAVSNAAPNMNVLSETHFEELEEAFNLSKNMTFDQRTEG